MAPKAAAKNKTPSPDPNGIFSGMAVLLVEDGVQPRRLQIWKQKLVQMGATIETRLSKKVTHVFAVNSQALLQQVDRERLQRFKGKVLDYLWIEDSLRLGEKVSEETYRVQIDFEGKGNQNKSIASELSNEQASSSDELSSRSKKFRSSSIENVKNSKLDEEKNSIIKTPESPGGSSDNSALTLSPANLSPKAVTSPSQDSSLAYCPPDLNRNITEIFGKLINIYRALGDDRRSFSYYKAIPVIEKLPFKIESSDQVKDLPGIGKSLQDHIQEIVSTGKLSKLEHYENDEKVRTISLFGEVWGIGPATALKLYDKGYRTLDDLKNEISLTHAQKIGLKYFDDIKTRIPRNEVQEMEQILQKAGLEILPGVNIICGGSYRRGKSSCGDMDMVITHPDGTSSSHKGFLSKFVKHLKDMKFLREDLVFSTHSEEGTDSGVDTYFGLCTYPGRELRHRIDFKAKSCKRGNDYHGFYFHVFYFLGISKGYTCIWFDSLDWE
ncbi:DNA polymerase lambda isoform X3 [Mercurialis annua]|uniref:DNA polymerase lambda isoform X3 n=1 Tax=Mercurialis annua TaxID=3986 RepID=UPI0024ADA108|nr:DNA polymerase lambda isoform X3 [Mercurialis annua]XP_055962370.1 DNA polymerase lambda isoform X3 [Mercurialis annua]